MDSPSGKNGLLGTVRRIEIYGSPEKLPSGSTARAVRSPPTRKSSVELGFEFAGIDGMSINVDDPKFHAVFPVQANMHSVGPIGAKRDVYGRDLGICDPDRTIPSTPEDLPVGFTETDMPQ